MPSLCRLSRTMLAILMLLVIPMPLSHPRQDVVASPVPLIITTSHHLGSSDNISMDHWNRLTREHGLHAMSDAARITAKTVSSEGHLLPPSALRNTVASAIDARANKTSVRVGYGKGGAWRPASGPATVNHVRCHSRRCGGHFHHGGHV